MKAKKSTKNSKIKVGKGNRTGLHQNKVIMIGFVAIFGLLGAFFLIRSFAATAPTYSASSASLTIGSWNTYVDNKNKLDTVVPTLLQKADVLSLQEVHTTAQRNAIKNKIICSTCAYDGVMYKNKNKGKTIDPRGGYPIIWKKGVFKRVSSLGVKKVADKLTGKIKFKARYAEWVTLQDTRTGQKFIILNTHTYSRVENKGGTYGHTKVNQGYKKQMAALKSLVASLKKKNLPIFVTGDLNVDYKHDTGAISWFPYNTFTPLGLVSNWKSADYTTAIPNASTSLPEDTLTSTSDEDVTDPPAEQAKIGTYKGKSSGERIIDYVYAWLKTDVKNSVMRSDVSFQSTEIDGVTAMDSKGLVYGSDHTPIFATYLVGTPAADASTSE